MDNSLAWRIVDIEGESWCLFPVTFEDKIDFVVIYQHVLMVATLRYMVALYQFQNWAKLCKGLNVSDM